MPVILLLILLLVNLAGNTQPALNDPNLKLWYNKPATIWEEALPLGNGNMGAMVFGGIKKERYQVNDNTLWSGYPEPGNNPQAAEYLPIVRKLIFEGNYDSATTVWRKHMQGPYSARYLPMGDLYLDFPVKDTIGTNYRRELDLNTAISTVTYKSNGVTYKRETFINYYWGVMQIRLTASKPASINTTVSLTSKLRYKTTPYENFLVLRGKAPSFVANRNYEPRQVVYEEEDGKGMNFIMSARVVNKGGALKTAQGDSSLQVTNANEVVIYLSVATGFEGFDKMPARSMKRLEEISRTHYAKLDYQGKDYNYLKKRHITDYQKLFNRVRLDLGVN
ncbi:MAG TPA: glycoside hydrolase family 95 protein, partial [Chitinophagaceae bacterium]